MEPNKDSQGNPLPPGQDDKPTPGYVRVLALLGALAVIAITIAYTYSLATGGIFWF